MSRNEDIGKAIQLFRAGKFMDGMLFAEGRRLTDDAGLQCEIAKAIMVGDGAYGGPVMAAMWFRLAAEGGSVDGAFNYGHCCTLGYGVERDYAEASKWLLVAAMAGVAGAQSNLGVLYLEGGYGLDMDWKMAVRWLKKAVEQHDEEACYNLAICYEYGHGVKKNYKKCFELYGIAARAGHEYAMAFLGRCYAIGIGAEKSLVDAAFWYAKSAASGCPLGQYYYGMALEYGFGVQRDIREACRLFKQAGDAGIEPAARRLEELRRHRPSNRRFDKPPVLLELDGIVGQRKVKRLVSNLYKIARLNEERKKHNLPAMDMPSHFVFTGSPGTGKTVVARILAKILHEVGIIPEAKLIETDRSGLVAGYTGQTAIKTNEIIDSALGGVLFIDEAYSLNGGMHDSFGEEAVATLIKRMEDDRGKFVVIAAGYQDDMDNFLSMNPGLKSRFNGFMEFSDYSEDELLEIFLHMAAERQMIVGDGVGDRVREYLSCARNAPGFANGRTVRNLLGDVNMMLANRLYSNYNIHHIDQITMQTILPCDIPVWRGNRPVDIPPEPGPKKKIGF
ncbi:MAG: AAA family ATPase [Victivallaceae bacterium]|nr:AAA family ATPase [Victivallaceae bacterium]